MTPMSYEEIQESLAAKARWTDRLSLASDENGRGADLDKVKQGHFKAERERAERLARDPHGLEATS